MRFKEAGGKYWYERNSKLKNGVAFRYRFGAENKNGEMYIYIFIYSFIIIEYICNSFIIIKYICEFMFVFHYLFIHYVSRDI